MSTPISGTKSNEKNIIAKKKEFDKTGESLSDYHDTNVFIPRQRTSNKEKLFVNPKIINMTQFQCFHIDCIYNGPHFLNIKLVWYKNGNYLDGSQARKSRIFIVDYIQNNTRISILKFAYAFLIDTGNYKCFAFNLNKKSTPILNDTVNIYVNLSEILKFILLNFKYEKNFNSFFISKIK